MRVLIRTAADITEHERRVCFDLWDRAFPQPPEQVRAPDFAESSTLAVLIDAGPMPVGGQCSSAVLVRDEVGTLVAACRLRDRTIVVDGEAVRVAGLASVAVVEDHRGQGLGTRLVQLATDTARVNGYAWSVLYCWPPTQAFYRRLGWQSLDGDVHVGPDGGTHALDRDGDAVMALPLTRAAEARLATWRTARIVLPNYW